MQVLIAAHCKSTRRSMVKAARELGLARIHEAGNAEEALSLATRLELELALVDVRLSNDPLDISGLDLVAALRVRRPLLAIVVGHEPSADELRQAMRVGASDWLSRERVDAAVLGRLLELLRGQASAPPRVEWARPARELPMIGNSPALQELRQAILRVASAEYPVLVRGPSGAGKELVVRELHRLGPRPDAPLLDINCGAIPDHLLESQLFGHKRGAFTGADRDQEGYLTAVGSGTLFLDEIAELPALLQAKLLRVLESGRFRMIGSTSELSFRGRVVAATHADLESRVRTGSFREDLYYRMAVLELRVPPLAERIADLPVLLDHFIGQQERRFSLSADAMELLANHRWPGNVRQLRNLVARMALLCDEDPVSRATAERLLEQRQPIEPEVDALSKFAESVLGLSIIDKFSAAQEALIEQSLKLHGGNKSAAARALGIHRKVLERRLGKSPLMQ
jgi:DNA-binding NtrC family response regulator